jgi:hypothetical protein
MLRHNQQDFDNIDDKLVVKVTRDLERFKQKFFILIDETRERLQELDAERKLVPEFDDYHSKLMDIEFGLLSELIEVYKKFADSYILDLGLFKWPKLSIAKRNPETLNKLYTITFTKLQEIQTRLAHITPPILYNARDSDKMDDEKAIYLLHHIMLDYSRAKPIRALEHMLDGFEYYGLGEEFKPVMEMLLKHKMNMTLSLHIPYCIKNDARQHFEKLRRRVKI